MEYIQPILRVFYIKILNPSPGCAYSYTICTIDGKKPDEAKAFFNHRLDGLSISREVEMNIRRSIAANAFWEFTNADFKFQDFIIGATGPDNKYIYEGEEYRLFWNLDHCRLNCKFSKSYLERSKTSSKEESIKEQQHLHEFAPELYFKRIDKI